MITSHEATLIVGFIAALHEVFPCVVIRDSIVDKDGMLCTLYCFGCVDFSFSFDFNLTPPTATFSIAFLQLSLTLSIFFKKHLYNY